MLSRPYLETTLWLLVLLLMLVVLCWVIDPWKLKNENIVRHTIHEQHSLHIHNWGKNEALISLEGLISWKSTIPLKKIILSAVTTQGNIVILESNSVELTYEQWVELTLPETVNTYLLEVQWETLDDMSHYAKQALEISFALSQRDEKSWFFWGGETANMQQILEY